MNIIEAIKSGKRYRRRGELGWYDAANDYSDYVFPLRSIVADDWEIEQVPVTITPKQFDAAWDRALAASTTLREWNASELHYLLTQELGL